MTEGVDFVAEYELRCTHCGLPVLEFEHHCDCGCTIWMADGPEVESMPAHWKFVEFKIAVGAGDYDIPFE